MDNNKANKAVAQFYHTLDTEVAASLNAKQKQEIELAVLSLGLVAKHSVDVRKSLPWFGKRYYLVLLCGRDRRQQLRSEESKLANFLAVSFTVLLILALVGLSSLALYLLKSALGIDIFENFSLGLWDWFKDLIH
ncbi:hypothetical protein FC652_04950 [Vibrio sp. 05-20-BW147]|uniref:hypothetical protein n=1 Tax=Vibrio sp. 05-20-BW147 TaxID=2575834 RepID=UPI00159468C6|nr:hypothetical protein [Vibrio sp. 05-20-BW147]NVC62474.1 hypothetical protein [Vibrio sp. 05-20-BW147]